MTAILLVIAYASGIGLVVAMIRECFRCHKHGYNYDGPAVIAALMTALMIGFAFLAFSFPFQP